MKSQDALNYAKIAFYIAMVATFSILTYQWATIESDFDELNNLIDNTLNKVQCKINFKDFHYSGFCIKQGEAFEFIKSYYNQTPTSGNYR